MVRRTLTAALVTLVFTLGSAGLASAAKPIRFSEEVSLTFTADCGSFDLLVELEGKEIVMLFLDAEGDLTRVFIAAPAVTASLTNLATGASIRLSLAGPAHVEVTPTEDSVKLVGPWLLDFDPETGEQGGWFLVTGQVTFTEDATGRSDLSFNGRAVDVCAELAG